MTGGVSMRNKIVGVLWNNDEISIAEVDGDLYALYGWNGEAFTNCWKVKDVDGLDKVDEETSYTIKPIYRQTGKENYEIADFKIIN